jgi:hypothetical protein
MSPNGTDTASALSETQLIFVAASVSDTARSCSFLNISANLKQNSIIFGYES